MRGKMRGKMPVNMVGRMAGFSLVELLVVLVIMALLAGLIVPRVTGYLDRARTGTARVQIEQLATALELYRVDMGGYPTSSEGLDALVKAPSGQERWAGPYLAKPQIPLDPWDREYVYQSPANDLPFEIYTLGADNAEGGEDNDADVRFSTLGTR